MDFCIFTARGCQEIKILVLPISLQMGLTISPTYFFTKLFLDMYIHINLLVRTLHQCPSEKDATSTTTETNNPNKQNKRNARNENGKKGAREKIVKVLEDFVGNFINICRPKLENYLLQPSLNSST